MPTAGALQAHLAAMSVAEVKPPKPRESGRTRLAWPDSRLTAAVRTTGAGHGGP